SFTVPDIVRFKQSLLHWSQQYYEVIWLDSNGHKNRYSSFDGMLAVVALTSLITDTQSAFEDLSNYQSNTKDRIFSYLSYDLKNGTERLSSFNTDSLDFPALYFFQPKKLIERQGTEVTFLYLNMVADEIEEDYNNILIAHIPVAHALEDQTDIKIKLRIFKDEYFTRVNKMLDHIHR